MNVHFSSKSDEWATPDYLYNRLHAEFNSDLDPCATHETRKCARHFSPIEDGLSRDWGSSTVFCNPPYSALRAWIQKAHSASVKGATVVMLIPARTDTKAFHKYIWDEKKHCPRPWVEVRFLQGRLKFKSAANSAPFPSMIVVFRKPL